MTSNHWIIGITGASGTIYARRLIRAMVEHVPNVQLDVVVSSAALRVLHEEEGLAVARGQLTAELLSGSASPDVSVYHDRPPYSLTLHEHHDIGASIASGSYPARGMVIVPCSMKTLAAVAHGYADNLISRAADVTLKERRPLVLVPRETPLSVIHLRNMLRLAKLGVAIVPAMPGFYHQPATVDDLVDLMVMRILDQMGYQVDLAARWGCRQPESADEPGGGKRSTA
jgi:4-hydroxy-3-polyprenylbenzoate decarboxylase